MAFVHPYRTIGELNQVERWKLDRHPLQVADDVIATYATEGPEAIAKVAGEAERLKWVGLYPQRQGGDAFMLRVKVPGGRLTAAQAREVGVVAEAFGEGPDDSAVFGNRYADLTTRQDVQIHWVRIGDVPRIWKRFAEVGLTTIQACGDSARNVLCCPVAGVDADEVFDALPAALAVTEFFTGNREYANLPRKFKMSATGCREDCAQAEIQDIGLWPARAGDGTVGFNVLVGGGLGDGERMASDIDVFVAPEDAVEVTRAIAQVFGELGNRENRGLARMRYLAQELGPEGFRREVAARTRLELRPAGEELTRRYRGDHVGVHPQRQPGLVYVGCSVPVGRMTGIELVEAARLAQSYGDGTVRLGTDQNFVLTGVAEERLDDLLAEPLLAKYSPFPGPFERGVVACTGNEFCRFAVVETKERAVMWARRLDAALGAGAGADHAGIVRMHFSGCSASCAQPQIADIGFRGDTAHVGERIAEAVDIGMGGSLGPEGGFIDWVENARPVDEVPEALLRVVRRYQDERRPEEPFHNWARRTPNDELRATLAGLAVGAYEGGRP
ncbi:MAG: ferredoxin--nitrite reductase [Acidobacteriota bacterium]|nr:ferredoxin--nitrite reductase [Acidobacteriota bacterium]